MPAPALQSTALPPKAASDDAVDLEKTPVDRVLAQLEVKPGQGLSSAEAERRLAKYGPNALVEKEESLARKLVGTSPVRSPT